MRKYLKVLLLITLLVLPMSVYAANLTPKVEDKTKKVYDYAEELDEEKENELQRLAENFIEENKMDMVLVIINNNPYGISDDSSITYAQDFFDYNDFGMNSSKDGILVLIDLENNFRWFLTTGKAQLIYDDERIESINNDTLRLLKEKDYYQAFVKYIESSSSYAKLGIPNSNKDYCIDEQGEYYNCAPKRVNWGITIIVAILGSALPVFIHTRKYKGIHLATNANVYLKNGTLNNKVDQFLTTFTSQIKRSHDSGGTGGHGGSSISHGSSGRSHGGGGGHF